MSHLVSYKWFRRTQYIPQFGDVLQENGYFTWRVSDCEEFSGGFSQEMVGFMWEFYLGEN